VAVKSVKATATKKPNGAKPKDDRDEILPSLNKKQLHFCELLLSGVQPNRAYIQAGYNVKNLNVARSAAARLLQNVSVREYVNRSKKQITKTYEINRAVLLENLMKIALGEVEEERALTVLIGDGCSQAVVIKQKTSPKDRVKATEILLSITADDTPTVESTINTTDKLMLESLSKIAVPEVDEPDKNVVEYEEDADEVVADGV
jgi:phage terminase small subunit